MRIVLALLLVLIGVVGPRPAVAQALEVELLYTEQDLASPPTVAPVQQRVVAEPGQYARLPLPRRGHGYWLRLTTHEPIVADSRQVLVLRGAQNLGPVIFHPPASAPAMVAQGIDGPNTLLRRGWQLPLPNGWPPAAVAYLHVSGDTGQALRLGLIDVDRLILHERAGARLASATFTALVLVAIFMFGLWVALRDLLYLSYAAYLACVAVYSMLLSGDAGEMLTLAWMTPDGLLARMGLGTLAVILQLIFTARFLELARLMPRAARVVSAMVWLLFGLLAVLLIGQQHVARWYPAAIHVLLLLFMPISIAVAIQAWRKGAAYAGHFIAGWTPLLAMAALMAAHQLGLVDVPWIERVLPLGAVLQSGVLALALSQHAANRHRIALLARQSAERDALTGALNRTAIEQMLAAWGQMGHLGVGQYALLLVDLDDFAEVNARHGYVVGDTVMQHVYTRIRGLVRPDDTVARMESDLFAVVSECRRDDAELLAHRLVEGFQQRPFNVDGHEIVVTVSVGLAMSRRGEDADALQRRAAEALAGVRIAGHSSIGVSSEPRTGEGRRQRGRAAAAREPD
ncbi:sensor domain-containing diguanylate cyclase [Marilutibacter chinensis]|uniref:GGDEF domain-containing protein n=1 Tax=Marilutibacter chinensis TaxID=2912247 RepID=A0ABS9HZR8_9GAMM|nr:diguanylate cyclase [Lysobacter chinensis]MCF7223682.1 GGDEF domain-containing protein [Lysobacter chinensis]